MEPFLSQVLDAGQLGGYEEVNTERWQVASIMKNQPEWRKKCLAKYKNIKEYAATPRELRIDPTFCPTPRRYSWEEH